MKRTFLILGTFLLVGNLRADNFHLPAISATPQKHIFTYDALGRLKSSRDPVNGYRSFVYDAAGNRTSVSVGAPQTSLPVLTAPKKSSPILSAL